MCAHVVHMWYIHVMCTTHMYTKQVCIILVICISPHTCIYIYINIYILCIIIYYNITCTSIRICMLMCYMYDLQIKSRKYSNKITYLFYILYIIYYYIWVIYIYIYIYIYDVLVLRRYIVVGERHILF